MKLIIEVTDDYYDECNRWVRQNVANLDQYVIANGVEYVEPKKGKWIKLKNMTKRSYQRVCSQCYNISYFCGDGNYPNCPYCLADMREADNEVKRGEKENEQ